MFRESQIVIITNFGVVSNVGIKRVVYNCFVFLWFVACVLIAMVGFALGITESLYSMIMALLRHLLYLFF